MVSHLLSCACYSYSVYTQISKQTSRQSDENDKLRIEDECLNSVGPLRNNNFQESTVFLGKRIIKAKVYLLDGIKPFSDRKYFKEHIKYISFVALPELYGERRRTSKSNVEKWFFV